MNLLIDIGNSNIKWSFSREKSIDKVTSVEYSIDTLESELNANLLSTENFLKIKNIVICCVAGKKIKSKISAWLATNSPIEPFYFETSDFQLGVRNAYQETSNLGNDRWLSLVYCHNHYHEDICIIDCGTAITIDVVLKNGQHQGGLIAPGYLSLITALQHKTNVIDEQLIYTNQNKASLLQNSTHHGVEHGSRIMSLGFIEYATQQLNQQYGDTLTVVLTGGDGASFSSELPSKWHFCPDLLFNALQFIADKQSELIRI